MFFGPGTQVQGSRVLRQLPESLLAEFDGDPVLPPPPQAGVLQVNVQIPGLVLPNLVLRKQDGNVQVSIGSQRVDVISPTGQIAGSLQDFLTAASETLLTVRRVVGARVPRVAAVVHRFRAIPTPARALAEQFCRDQVMGERGPLNRPENFELHAHKVFRTDFGVSVNSWVRNRSALLAATNTPVVSVEQDMNTLPPTEGEPDDLPDASIGTFFRGIAAELDRALALYYPDQAAGT